MKTPTQAAKSGPLEWGTLVKIIELDAGLPGSPAEVGILFAAMKRLLCFALLSVSIAVVKVEATEKSEYQTGKLVDMSSTESGAGAGRGQRIFCLAVETGDLDYTLHYWPNWRGSYEPTDLVVGDSVEVMVNKNHLYIKKKNGGDLKTDIVRRERKSPDRKPTTCALPVSTQN